MTQISRVMIRVVMLSLDPRLCEIEKIAHTSVNLCSWNGTVFPLYYIQFGRCMASAHVAFCFSLNQQMQLPSLTFKS